MPQLLDGCVERQHTGHVKRLDVLESVAATNDSSFSESSLLPQNTTFGYCGTGMEENQGCRSLGQNSFTQVLYSEDDSSSEPVTSLDTGSPFASTLSTNRNNAEYLDPFHGDWPYWDRTLQFSEVEHSAPKVHADIGIYVL